MKKLYLFKKCFAIVATLLLCGVLPAQARQELKLTTNKTTRGNSNSKKFCVALCGDTTQDVIIDWGDTRIDTVRMKHANPDDGMSKFYRHFQDGKKEHTVSIKGDGVTHLKVTGQKLIATDFAQGTQLQSLTITGENALTSLDLAACSQLKHVACNNNSLATLTVPQTLTKLNCSGNCLSIAMLPDLATGMNVDDYVFAPQRPHALPGTMVQGMTIDLSAYTNRKGVTTQAQTTEFSFTDANGASLPADSYENIGAGIYKFKQLIEGGIVCHYSTEAFPNLEFSTLPFELTAQQPDETYRFGYSYGTPSAKGSEKAGSKLWYAAGPVFTSQELEAFKGDKITGVRAYLHQDYAGSKVFVRAGLDKAKGNLAEKIVDLKAGWNEINFDTPIEVPQDSLLVAYFIRTENKTDVVLSGDKSVFNRNHLWEMIQDRQEAPNPDADFYEKDWINSSKALPAAPVQVLLTGNKAHFENRLTVVGFYPPFYAPIDNNNMSELPILLANRGLNNIETVEVTYTLDGGEKHAVELPVELAPYEQQSSNGNYLKMNMPYPDTQRHLLALELTKVNGTAQASIMNPTWSQLTQGYHKNKTYPRTPLVETLMSEGDPFAANAEKNVTSLLAQRTWAGHNIVRMDYHLGVGDHADNFELPEMVFNTSVGRLAIMSGEKGYTPEQETVLPSIMVDRDIMTTYAKYLYKGSPFMPVLDNSSMAQLLIADAIVAPGFAELSIMQNAAKEPQGTQFTIEGVISPDVVNPQDLYITVCLVEKGLMGKQLKFDPFTQEVATDEAFVHAPIVRAFVSYPSGDKLTVQANGNYSYQSPVVFLPGMNVDKTDVVAFIHRNAEGQKLGNMVLNTTSSNIDPNKINPESGVATIGKPNISCHFINGTLVIEGDYREAMLYDLQGHIMPHKHLAPGAYVARIVDTAGGVHLIKLLNK